MKACVHEKRSVFYECRRRGWGGELAWRHVDCSSYLPSPLLHPFPSAGFIGLELCKGRPLAPVYVAVQGLCLLAYLGLAEVSGAVAIWKGRRWGVLVLFLSQSLVVLTLMFGYLVLWPLDTSFLEQVQLSNRVNTSLLARVNTSSPSNMTAPSPDCVPAYLTFARVLHGLGHLAVFLALVYSLVACACLVQAAKQRLRVEPPVIDHHAALYRQIESHKRFKKSSRNNKW